MNTIGLGNALVDVLLKLENDDILPETGIRKGAMEMISEEQMTAIRKLQENLEQSQAPGGSACNVMRALACLGASSGFIGKIGTDAAGEYYEKAVNETGVIPFFIKAPGISGSCTVLISPDGEKTMATFLGPAPTIKPDEITDEMLNRFHCIYIEGYMIVNEELMQATMDKAKSLGLKVALDLSNYNIVNHFLPKLKRIVPQYVDILFSNESEAESYTGLKAEEAIKVLGKQVDTAVITLGKEGIMVTNNNDIIKVKAEGGVPLDTTGAGDHFAAGFLYGLSAGASLLQSAQIGSLLAGYVIDVIGPAIPASQWKQIKLKVNRILS